MGKKILVTGAAGFIGFHLVNKLIKEDYEIIGLDNINDYYDVNLKYARLQNVGIEKNKITYNTLVKSNLSGNYKFIKLDLADYKNLKVLFETQKFDFVVNLAAQAGVRYSLQNPHVYVESNIMGFLNILENSRDYGIKHLLYASSSSVYGLNKKQPFSTDDNVAHPISIYAATKRSNELMAHTYSYLFNLPTTGLRFFTVYGPWGRPDMAYFSFTEKIMQNEPIKVFNHGKMKRDFTYIDDIIEGVSKIITLIPQKNKEHDFSLTSPKSSPAPFNIYNIGNNKPVNLMDFIKEIEKATEKKAKLDYQPMQPGDVKVTYADIDDLIREVGYKPTTNIQKGIKRFVDWYLNFYKKYYD